MVKTFPIPNPKRTSADNSRTNWFSYYAGFSPDFVRSVIESADVSKEACIADPWNGGGTTTTISNALGYSSKGIDLNPVMIIAAKACLLSSLEIPSISPVMTDIIRKASYSRYQASKEDPLNNWLGTGAIQQFRSLEQSIKKLLIEPQYYNIVESLHKGENTLSSLACFFYVGLFRLLKSTIQPFFSSNPTWIKVAKNELEKITVNRIVLLDLFRKEIDDMVLEMSRDTLSNKVTNANTEFAVANSESLPWKSNSIDLIITSPPYCTRIDYAVATMPELALLHSEFHSSYDDLRRSLIGTTTVPKNNISINENWGKTCINFLNEVYSHKSKASKSYYFKSHTQYFRSIFNSISEIERVLKYKGKCAVVIQDSFYKDIHNNLPKIFSEMISNHGLRINQQVNFPTNISMSDINPKIKQYRNSESYTESIIFFEKF